MSIRHSCIHSEGSGTAAESTEPVFPLGLKLFVQAKHLVMQNLAELFAIADCRHGRTKHNGCPNRLFGQQIERVGKQRHIAPPADFPLDHAIVEFVADGAGRHLRIGIDCGLQHGGVKALDASSVARGALGKKDDRHSDPQALGDTVICARSIGPIVTADEHASRPAGIAAEDGPTLDLCFRHEDARHSGAQDENVEIAEMVAHDQPMGRQGPSAGYMDVDGRQPARTTLMQPLGALRARSIAPQLAMFPESIQGRCRDGRQSNGSSQLSGK